MADCIVDDLEIALVDTGSSIVLDWLSVATSLLVNMIATSMIAWKAWYMDLLCISFTMNIHFSFNSKHH